MSRLPILRSVHYGPEPFTENNGESKRDTDGCPDNSGWDTDADDEGR